MTPQRALTLLGYALLALGAASALLYAAALAVVIWAGADEAGRRARGGTP